MSIDFDVSRATVRVVPDLIKALVILSATTIKRFSVRREDLKPWTRNQKNTTFLSRWSKYFCNNRKTYEAVAFSQRALKNIPKHRNQRRDFPITSKPTWKISWYVSNLRLIVFQHHQWYTITARKLREIKTNYFCLPFNAENNAYL